MKPKRRNKKKVKLSKRRDDKRAVVYDALDVLEVMFMFRSLRIYIPGCGYPTYVKPEEPYIDIEALPADQKALPGGEK